MNRVVRIVWNCIAWTLVAIVLLIAVGVAVPPLFGVKAMNVLTDSMSHLDSENEYRDRIAAEADVGQFLTGTLIYVVPTEIEDIEEFDVITMTLPGGGYLTHRVVEIGEKDGQPWLYTMGDANNDLDFMGSGIGEDRLVGKAVLAIPMLGSIVDDVQEDPLIILPGVVILLLFLFMPDIVRFVIKLWKSDEEKSGEGDVSGDGGKEAETEADAEAEQPTETEAPEQEPEEPETPEEGK